LNITNFTYEIMYPRVNSAHKMIFPSWIFISVSPFFRLVYHGWTINLRPKETTNSLSRRETDTDGAEEDGTL